VSFADTSGELAELGRRLEDPTTSAEQLAAIANAIEQLPALRLDVCRELRRQGLHLADIAELAGVTRGRISQLLGPLDALERRRIANAELARRAAHERAGTGRHVRNGGGT